MSIMAYILAGILVLQVIQVLQGYETLIAVYNSTAEFNNCSDGADYSYSIDKLPTENVTNGTLLKFCSDTYHTETGGLNCLM